MGYSVKNLAEVKVDNIHRSPLICLPTHAIIEGYQNGQELFSLGESLLTTDNLIFLHMLRDDIQKELFCHISKDRGKADLSVVQNTAFSVQNCATEWLQKVRGPFKI